MKIGAKVWFWLIIVFNTPLTIGRITLLFYNTGQISSLIVSSLYLAGAIILLNEKKLGAFLLFFGAVINALSALYMPHPALSSFLHVYYATFMIFMSFLMLLITYVLVIREWHWFD